jgi:hypothetical protein
MRPSADENICRQCGEHDEHCECRCTECNANMWPKRFGRIKGMCPECSALLKGDIDYEQEQAS